MSTVENPVVIDCYLALFRSNEHSQSTHARRCSKADCKSPCEIPLCTCENHCMCFGDTFIRYMPMFRGESYVEQQSKDNYDLYPRLHANYEWRVLPNMSTNAFAVVQKLVRDSDGNLFQWHGVTYYEDPVYHKLSQVELNAWYSCFPTVLWRPFGKPDYRGRRNEIRVNLQEYLLENKNNKEKKDEL